MIAEIRYRCLRAIEFATISPALLWTLLRARWRLAHGGLEAAIDAATSTRQRPPPSATVPLECEQQRRSRREDELICWWLLALRVHAICLYRCLVMLERLSSQPRVETVELVIGVRRAAAGGLGHAHSWLVVNGRPFRTGPDVVAWYEVLSRFPARPGAQRANGLRAQAAQRPPPAVRQP